MPEHSRLIRTRERDRAKQGGSAMSDHVTPEKILQLGLGFWGSKTLLSATDVFVSHMGANSMHEALFYGVPLVCVPHSGDGPQNAERVVAQGAGVLMPPGEISAPRVAAEVERVSGESFRANAARLSRSLRTGGGLERALRVIEGITTVAPSPRAAGRPHVQL